MSNMSRTPILRGKLIHRRIAWERSLFYDFEAATQPAMVSVGIDNRRPRRLPDSC